MESNIQIHRASVDELAAVQTIIDDYCEAIGVLVRDDRAQIEQYFNVNSGIWLASCQTSIVGCVVLRPLALQAEACEVKRLYVRELYRGKSVADKLMDALEVYAVSYGYRFAYLDTKNDLRAAIRFYERRGYDACERYNDNPQATIFMRRRLR